jgi:hypothetical protein
MMTNRDRDGKEIFLNLGIGTRWCSGQLRVVLWGGRGWTRARWIEGWVGSRKQRVILDSAENRHRSCTEFSVRFTSRCNLSEEHIWAIPHVSTDKQHGSAGGSTFFLGIRQPT